MKRRMRRLRRDGVREMVAETDIESEDLIAPIFVDATKSEPAEIPSMPNQYRYPLEKVAEKARELHELGIRAVILFGVPEEKDSEGSRAYAEDGIVQEAVREIKNEVPELVVVTDVCMCEYTDHGHCGILDESGEMTVDNDATLPLLAKTAVSHAEAGADIVAPSGMMDRMVGTIRDALDENGYSEVAILSYAVKYSSAFYGPFRDAADSAPSFGDRSHYQMNPPNRREAIEEARLDIEEGADILMVKPALPYLDIVREVRDEFDVPLAAYNVSGEYAMLKAADHKGWMNADEAAEESLTSIKRAGADLILTYFAEEIAKSQI